LYLPGLKNDIADFLSRPSPESTETVAATAAADPVDFVKMAAEQNCCAEMQHLLGGSALKLALPRSRCLQPVQQNHGLGQPPLLGGRVHNLAFFEGVALVMDTTFILFLTVYSLMPNSLANDLMNLPGFFSTSCWTAATVSSSRASLLLLWSFLSELKSSGRPLPATAINLSQRFLRSFTLLDFFD
jgi:hypothetical protein